jgi:hypothetical protein
MGRRGVLMAGIVLFGLVAAGCDGGSDEKAGSSALFHLRTGECFESSAGTAGVTVEVKDVASVPCAEAHDGEVFAAAECLQKFPDYTGASYDDSDLEVASVRPDHDSWSDKDDREVACVLYKRDATLTGSRRRA